MEAALVRLLTSQNMPHVSLLAVIVLGFLFWREMRKAHVEHRVDLQVHRDEYRALVEKNAKSFDKMADAIVKLSVAVERIDERTHPSNIRSPYNNYSIGSARK